MELAWLEDFQMLIECGNFTRAAERRNITQPAFSRRIRALEEWVGAPLFNRHTRRVTVTPAGASFRPVAEEAVRRIYIGREEAREASQALGETLKFASTHALSLTFFPTWLRSVELQAPRQVPVRFVADTMAACERIMIQGAAQFLLCHHHHAASISLEPAQFRSISLGEDVLVPVCAPSEDAPRAPRFPLPGTAHEPLPYLAYSSESGLGRIVAATRVIEGHSAHLAPAFTSHVAVVLAMMAREGRGIAWLPQSIVDADIEAGRLTYAGGKTWNIRIEIRLFRPRSRQNPVAERFWTRISAGSVELDKAATAVEDGFIAA